MQKHTAKVSPLTACDSPVLSLAWIRGSGQGGEGAGTSPPGAGKGRRGARVAALALCLAGCWAGTTQMGRAALLDFPAPFFAAVHSGGCNLLLFPGYWVARRLLPQRGIPTLPELRACSRLLGEDGFSCRGLLSKTGPFCILWTLTTYLYLLALRHISPTEASALFCCNKAFVFLLSWIVLKDRFMGVRIVAAILSITGIVLTAYADGFRRDSILGVALVVASASASALYKVLFRLLLGPAGFGEAMFFLSAMGAFSLVFLSWVSALLFALQVEPWPSAALVPWDRLFGLSSLLLVFNVLINCGTAVSSSTLVSLGVFLSVPANAAIDVYRGCWPGSGLGQVRLSALLVLCLAFLLLLLPEEWDTAALGLLAKLRGRMVKEDTTADHGEGHNTQPGLAASAAGTAHRAHGELGISPTA